MKFSVFSLMQWPPGGARSPVYENELEQLTVAESQGYDGAWLGEHPSSRYGIGPSIHLTAANLAARTSRIRIGTAVSILPCFHPLRLAEELAMLDIMSDGRFDWGVGRGDEGPDLAAFAEQLEIMRLAWTGRRFSYDGEFFEIPELQCLPNPVQDPHPPIWITARSPSTLEWAARNDRPLLTDPFSPTPRIEESRRIYAEVGRAAGFDVTRHELPVVRPVYVGESTAKAREEASAALLDRRFESCAIIGDEGLCREKIAELQERIGLTHLIAWQSFGDLTHEASLASQRRLIEKVAPSFK